ncbi:MAG: TetR/AcrR family transcriptional regulator [Pseudomonadota bacterium]
MPEESLEEGAKPLYQMRKQPVQSRAHATVDAILEAAARVLIDDGYSAANTNHIAERAGVSIGSLYEYFPGKEAIFTELRRRVSLGHYTEFVKEPRPIIPTDVIRHLVSTRIKFLQENLELYTALETEVPRSSIAETEGWIFSDFLQISIDYFEAHREILQPTGDLAFISEFLMRFVSATLHDYAIQAPEKLYHPSLQQEMIQLVERYVLKPEFRQHSI